MALDIAPARPLTAAELPTQELRSIELFTGAGGLALGTLKAGFHHRHLVEWDHDACETLRANARDRNVRRALPGVEDWDVIEGDVRDRAKIDFSNLSGLDLIAGGAPCQPFSIGGKHRGMHDERDMLPHFARAVHEARPRAFVLENVRGLIRPAFLPYFEYILLLLKYPGFTRRSNEDWKAHRDRLNRVGVRKDPEYRAIYGLVNAANYGVPQVRNRVVVVGFRADLGIEPEIPAATHGREMLDVQKWITGEYWDRHGLQRQSVNRQVAIVMDKLPRKLPALQPWRTVRDAIADLPDPAVGMRSAAPVSGHWVQPGARPYVGHSGSEYDLPAKTLKAGDHGVPGGENMLRREDGSVRYFTVRETARLQTFPDEWTFEGAWGETMRQLGNAVPVRLAEVIARAVARRLRAAG